MLGVGGGLLELFGRNLGRRGRGRGGRLKDRKGRRGPRRVRATGESSERQRGAGLKTMGKRAGKMGRECS